MTEPTTAHPLRALLCRLFSCTRLPDAGELTALRAENEELRTQNEELRAENDGMRGKIELIEDFSSTDYKTLFAKALAEGKPRMKDLPLEAVELADLPPLTGGMDDETAIERLVDEFCAKNAPVEGAPVAPEPDHGESWEFMQPVANGAAAEREAFEALADEQDPNPSDDEWASLAEDEEPITDAEIADTLGALFDAAAEMRAERLAAEADAAANDDLAPDAEVGTDSAMNSGDTIGQGEPQPDAVEGWSERTVYGVTVLGAPQDRAWSTWLSGKELTRVELRRLLIEEGVEKRVATETVSRMLQHSRAKATVGKRKNDSAYHLLKKAG